MEFRGLGSRLTWLIADIGRSALQSLLQRHRVNPEILRDLLDRDTRLTVPRNTNHVVTELS